MYLKLLVRHLQQKYDSYSSGVPAIVPSTIDDQIQICRIKFKLFNSFMCIYQSTSNFFHILT